MDKNEKINILIGTPCYGGLIHQDYFQAAMDYFRLNLPVTFIQIGNESLITRGRNTIASVFHGHGDLFTHLLFLDADVYLSGADLVKMIQDDVDVVGAPVPMKGFNPDGTLVYNVSNILSDEVPGNPNLVEVDRVGTAALLFKKKAIDSLVNDAIKENRVYERNKLSRGEKIEVPHYDIFRVGVVDGLYLSEDFFVCHELRRLGYNVYVDKTINCRHSGTFTFG